MLQCPDTEQQFEVASGDSVAVDLTPYATATDNVLVTTATFLPVSGSIFNLGVCPLCRALVCRPTCHFLPSSCP